MLISHPFSEQGCPRKDDYENIAGKILAYLQKNPDAGDTFTGITKWWLEFERIEQAAEEVKKALKILLQHDLVETVPHREDIEGIETDSERNLYVFRATKKAKRIGPEG